MKAVQGHTKSTGRLLVLAALVLSTAPALAHTQEGLAGGLLSGFMHPILGPDHLVAMVAVGLWGAQLRAPAIWLLPITFPAVMAVGGLLGILGVPVPFIEVGVATSAVVLGLMVAMRAQPGIAIAAALVAVFAVFHGYAHGAELPEAANPLAYGVGFVVSTGLLHLAGITLGVAVRWPTGERLVRACGGAIAMVGGYFLAVSTGIIA